jgi:hypothetical protein
MRGELPLGLAASCVRSYRTLRDGALERRFPRHFVPGYDRVVPPGQNVLFSGIRITHVVAIRSLVLGWGYPES